MSKNINLRILGIVMIGCVLMYISCNSNSEDTCYSPYKVIIRPDGTVADSIFINCTNKNLFFHKKMYDGRLQSTGYLLNDKLTGIYTMYDDDGKTVIFRRKYKNGIVTDSL